MQRKDPQEMVDTHKTTFFLLQDVLKWDKENYMALVLLGAAHQDSNKTEAAKHLRRAVATCEDHLLALQGLVNCAEVDELSEIYGKLMKLQP